MDLNQQPSSSQTPLAKRRRNRSNRKTQPPKPTQVEQDDRSIAPASPSKNAIQNTQPLEKQPNPAPTVVAAPPKRHRIRHRIRNKTQTLETKEVANQASPTIDDLVPLTQSIPVALPTNPTPSPSTMIANAAAVDGTGPTGTNPNKAQVLAEREAKRLAKLAAKHKLVDSARNIGDSSPEHSAPSSATVVPVPIAATSTTSAITDDATVAPEKSREEVIAEREAKKLAKLAAKTKTTPSAAVSEVIGKVAALSVADKPVLSKAERRAKQEAQRAVKAAAGASGAVTAAAKSGVASSDAKVSDTTKTISAPTKKLSPSTVNATAPKFTSTALHRVKLFNHLYTDREPPPNAINSPHIHPSVVKLGAQFANGVVVGSNARCIAFINTIKQVVAEYKTPPQKEFSRGLEATLQPYLAYLQQCRPLSVSIINANKFIKWQITQLPADEGEAEQRERLIEAIDTYIRDQVEKAAQAISSMVQEKISNGDVLLTFGCSSLINHILNDAKSRNVDFRVVVVDARPDHEGQEMLRRLVEQGIKCTCVLVNAVGFIMPEVTKVLLGAHALLANGYVMSRAGTAQVALMAKAHNVPVLVCCETHKFSERVQTDAFVYNEIGNPNDLVLKSQTTRDISALANWESVPKLTPLNLRYDITPPELVTAVVTELAILPCTSVPVILRIQPSS